MFRRIAFLVAAAFATLKALGEKWDIQTSLN